MRDDYKKEVIDPIVSNNLYSYYWEATLFLEENEEELQLGVQLIPTTIEKEKIEAIEFFVVSSYGMIIFQDLQLDKFDGEITVKETCKFCNRHEYDDYFPFVDITVNWLEDGRIKSDQLVGDLDWEQYMPD